MEPIERIFVTLTENQIRQGYSLKDAANTAFFQMTTAEEGQVNAIKHFEGLLTKLKDLKTAPDPVLAIVEPEGIELDDDAAELPGVVEKSAKTRK